MYRNLVLTRSPHIETYRPGAWGKGADLTPPCVSLLASPHRSEASDGVFDGDSPRFYIYITPYKNPMTLRGARPFKVWLYLIRLRSQNGQNGQILFISGEQLSLIVAGDSAKTLSVLGNMGDALDDCRLRFVQKCRRPPSKYPDFGDPTDFFEKLPSKPPPRISPTWPT